MWRSIRRRLLGIVALSSGLAIAQPAFSVVRSQAVDQSVRALSRCQSDWVVRSPWSSPARDAFAGNVFAGSPAAALGRSGPYVVGRVHSATANDTGVPPTRLIGPDGTSLPLPAGAERGQVDRVAVAGADSIYLLWGVATPSTDTVRGRRIERLTEVWFSSRTRGKGWTDPARLFNALAIGWDSQLAEVVRDGRGAFHLAFAAEREWTRTTLVHVTMRRGAASIATTELRSPAAYVHAVTTSRGVLIGFVAPDVVKAHNANSVFVIDADEKGFHPPARLVMSSPGEEQAIALRAVATANDVVHLVWIELRGAGAGSLLRHTLSRDGGSRWTPWMDAAYGGVPQITAMPDGRDGLQVFYTVVTEPNLGYSETMCWNGDWESPVRLGGPLRVLDAHPVAGSSARPSLLATELVLGSPATTYRVVWLERSPTRPCPPGRAGTPCPK